MKQAKKTWALLLILIMIPGLFGCGNQNGLQIGDSAENETDQEVLVTRLSDVQKDTDLNVMLETPVLTLDPQMAMDGASFEVIANYTDGLMQMDESGRTVNALCQSYKLSEDGCVYTFTIHRNANWSNGEPVTAEDFVFAWRRAVDPANACEYAYMLSDIGRIKNAAEIISGEKDKSELGVTALDEKTLQVELEEPVSFFLSLLYFPTFYPVNEDFYQACGEEFGTGPETVLSNGAFVLDAYEPGCTAFHLSKNEDYYNAKRIKLSGIHYQVIQDSQLAMLCYERGTLDVALVTGDEADLASGDMDFERVGTGCLWYVTPNLEVAELNNLNLRKALTMAIDREEIVQEVLQDGSKATYTVIPQQFVTGPDGKDFSADRNKYEEVCVYNVEQATEYWNKALAELGVTELTLELLADADDAPQMVAEELKAQWEKALPGLTVTVVTEPKNRRIEAMQEGTFQLALTRWGPDYADPVTYLGMFVGDNPYNYARWSNKDYDAMLEQCTTGKIRNILKKRWETLGEAEALVMEDVVIFPLYTGTNAAMVSANVTGVEFHPLAIQRVFKDAIKQVAEE